jgi:hypothetical protein
MIEKIIDNIKKILANLSRQYNVNYSRQLEERMVNEILSKKGEIEKYIRLKKLTPEKIYKNAETVFIASISSYRSDREELQKGFSDRMVKTAHLNEAISNNYCRVYPFCAKLMED